MIIEFAEDSPAFRRRVEALDRNVEGEIRFLLRLFVVLVVDSFFSVVFQVFYFILFYFYVH